MRMIIFALLLAISYAQTAYKYESHLTNQRCVSNDYWTGRADTLDECALRCGAGIGLQFQRTNDNNKDLTSQVPLKYMTWVPRGDKNCACQPECVIGGEDSRVDVWHNVATPGPTAEPTKNPTVSPTMSPLVPTMNPTAGPTKNPTVSPTKGPTANPTESPIRILDTRCGPNNANGEPLSYANTCAECPNTPDECNGDHCHMWTFSTNHVNRGGSALITEPASQCQPKCCTGAEADCDRYPWDVRRLIKIFCDDHDRNDGRPANKQTEEFRYAGALRRVRNAKRNGFRFSQQCPRAVEPCNIWNAMHEDLKAGYSKENWNKASRHLDNLKRWYDEEDRGEIALNCDSASNTEKRVECPKRNGMHQWNTKWN